MPTSSPATSPDDATQWWEAYCLADSDQVDELRQRADAGNAHALDELAGWLATHHRLDELRELISALDEPLPRLASWQACHYDMDVTRLYADFGDDDARRRLDRWLARRGHVRELRQRTDAGDDYASRLLAETLGQWS